MQSNNDIKEPLFRQAVDAIDDGNTTVLELLLNEHPSLVQQPLDHPSGDYFNNPYLLYFVADNPIRHQQLPPNIAEVTALIISVMKQCKVDNLQQQLDYTLGLVASGSIPVKCNVQIPLMEKLIEEGATAGNGMSALAHANLDAVRYLLSKGGQLTLPVAVGLNMPTEAGDLAETSDQETKNTALAVAAFYGHPAMVSLCLQYGAEVNSFPPKESGFHTHCAPIHQAIVAKSLQCVQLLVDAGADLSLVDKIYCGFPLGWATHFFKDDAPDETSKKKYADIIHYLMEKEGYPAQTGHS